MLSIFKNGQFDLYLEHLSKMSDDDFKNEELMEQVNAKFDVYKEVVQFYSTKPDSQIDRPVRELRTFVKTKMLNPGETTLVSVNIPLADLRYWSEEELRKHPISDFLFLSDDLFEEVPIFALHELKFKKSFEYGSPTDVGFGARFGELNYYDFEDTLDEKKQKILSDFFDVS